MKIFKNLKKKHYFLFKKTYLDIQDEDEGYSYRAMTDTYLFLKAKTIADNNKCKMIAFRKQDWSLEGQMIVLYATEDDFMNFCLDFCSTFKKYIENIEIK